MSDVKVEQKQSLSRKEAARFIQALADGLGNDGRVAVQLGTSTLELSVASRVDCELEVAVDGDEIELELELKWSISGRSSAEAAQDESAADGLDEDEVEDDAEEDEREEDEPAGDTAEGESEQEVAAEDEAADIASVEEAAGSREAESVSAVTPEQTARPRRGRRKAAAEAGRPAINGVDTAAVRAWAAANGVTVSPRGRIKDEVIEAYRAAGN